MLNDLEKLYELVDQKGGEVELWACYYKQDNLLKRADRHLKPTKVLVKSTQAWRNVLEGKAERVEYPEKRIRVYPRKKNGSLGKDIPYDAKFGIINFFFDEANCIEVYNTAVFEAIQKFEKEKEKTIKQMDRKLDELKNSFVKSDYTMETLSRT